jgi:diguanylate cyclase (GGDEF)-like protein
MQRLLIVLMVIYATLFLLANFDFKTMMLATDNWIEYVLLVLFYILLFQFWSMARRVCQQNVLRASITDSLSSLFNSQHFFRTLEAEIDRSRRKGHGLSAMLVDIDYFHRYNQTHGLRVGDRVLRRIGEIVRSSTRKYDTGFRFGNDDFALILPETDRMESRIIGERLRETFESLYGGELALSIGVATLDENDDVDRLLRKAELAMEEARRGGGNRTRTYIERGQI